MHDWCRSDGAGSARFDAKPGHHSRTIQDIVVDWRKATGPGVRNKVELGYYTLNCSLNCREHHEKALMIVLTREYCAKLEKAHEEISTNTINYAASTPVGLQ